VIMRYITERDSTRKVGKEREDRGERREREREREGELREWDRGRE
jgi:hypothetical protein